MKLASHTASPFAQTTVPYEDQSRSMPTLTKNLRAIREAVASILRSGDHVGKLYSSTDIALALNAASDADNNPEIDISIDSKLVIRAFVFDGKLEYTLPYCSYFGYDGDDRVLFYRHFR